MRLAIEGRPCDAALTRMFLHPDADHAGIVVGRREGFVEIPLFGRYLGEPFSICTAKSL